MKALLIISRIIVGLLFIFSGFVKAVDPLGFSYKLDEYFVVFGMPSLSAISLYLSMIICSLEILVGVALLVGAYMNRVAWLLLLMMIFFTWLTGFTVVTGEVTDCGCFGDAITLTPLETFIKDVVLLILAVVIFIYRNSIKPLFQPKWARISTLTAGGITLLLTIYCYNFLPLIDFRPYKVGNNIPKLMNDGVPGEYKTIMIYKNKNTGETKEFTANEIGDLNQDVWEWEGRKDKVIKPGKPATIHDFHLEDVDGNDFTDMVLTDPQPLAVVVAYDIENTSASAFKAINKIREDCKDKNIKFIALTATPYNKTDSFRHEVQAAYPFYFADATTLKTIIRSNPGLMLIHKGTVLGKWHYNALPSCQELVRSVESKTGS